MFHYFNEIKQLIPLHLLSMYGEFLAIIHFQVYGNKVAVLAALNTH